MPETWFVGVGISLSFLAGEQPRAPAALQRLGLEWVHRLAHEPRRLLRRYVLDGLPFGFKLLAWALMERATGRAVTSPDTEVSSKPSHLPDPQTSPAVLETVDDPPLAA
jgi:N-acetylglucosaminyldiphosphoundecaprenol N-acetyl-beta-D-mannosaminyltransferase